jgi:hypothetical protein
LRADEGAVVYIHPQTQVNKPKNKRMYASTGLEVKPKLAEKSRKDILSKSKISQEIFFFPSLQK